MHKNELDAVIDVGGDVALKPVPLNSPYDESGPQKVVDINEEIAKARAAWTKYGVSINFADFWIGWAYCTMENGTDLSDDLSLL